MSRAPAKALPAYASAFVEELRRARVELVTALPESLLIHIYGALAEDEEIRYVPVTNEGEMPGIVVGSYLGGKRALMMMENSGIRTACEPIARFSFAMRAPMVMVMPFRGDFGERNWWGHDHAQTMEPLLEALRIPYRVIRRVSDVPGMVDRAFVHAQASQWPAALVLSGECVNGERGQYAAF